jgi:hypothetical protein
MFNIFQIWISGQPPAEILAHMESIVDCVGGGNTYTLVAESNFLSHKPGVIFSDVRDEIADVQQRFPDTLKFWSTIIDEHRSDVLRYALASEIENFFYLDCDCRFTNGLPKPVSARPHFIQASMNGRLVNDFCVFQNSNTQFFLEFTQQLVAHMASDVFNPGRYSDPFKLLNNFIRLKKQRYSLFDESSIAHHN